MRRPARSWRRGCPCGAALSMALALCVPPASAGQPFDPWNVMAPASGDAACAGDTPARIAAEPLTLDRAISLALCTSPRARSAWAATAAQAALLGQARATQLPAVNLSASRTRDAQDGVVGPDTTVQTTGANLTLSWLLFDFGARRASITQAEQNLEAALGSREAAVQDTVVEVAQAWYDAQTAVGAVAAAEVAQTSASEIVKAAEARLASGSIIALDVVKARNALTQARLVVARARGNERITHGALARVLGLDVRAPQVLSFEGDDSADGGSPGSPGSPGSLASRSPVGDLETMVGEALAAHPALRAARSQVAAAEARLDGVNAERWPSLSLSYGYYRNGRPGTALVSSQSQEQLVALTLTIPLFDGFGHAYRVHEQQANVQARRADAAAVESRIGFEVWRAYQAVEAETSAVAASAELVRGTQEALAATRARYVAGASDITDLLIAQRDDGNARQERVTALAAWRNARLRLLASLGTAGFWSAR